MKELVVGKLAYESLSGVNIQTYQLDIRNIPARVFPSLDFKPDLTCLAVHVYCLFYAHYCSCLAVFRAFRFNYRSCSGRGSDTSLADIDTFGRYWPLSGRY